MQRTLALSYRLAPAAALLLVGCASVTKLAPPSGGKVTTYVQSTRGEAANLYWFDTPSGPVVIDAPLLTSEAKKLRSALVKPYRIYVTAARPERFGGLAALRDGEIPVYSTPAIASEIKDKGDERLLAAQKKYGADVATHVDAPTPAVEERTSDMVAEVEVEFFPIGPARSDAALGIYLVKSRELILGELVNADEHLDLSAGRAAQWHQKLLDLRSIEARHVYPGHGAPGGPELINQTLEYLSFFVEAIKQKAKAGAPAKIAPAELIELRKKLLARFPKHGAQNRIEASIEGEYATQLAALPPAPAATPTEPGPALAPTAPAPTATPTATTTPPVTKKDGVTAAAAPAPALTAKKDETATPAAPATAPATKKSETTTPAPAAKKDEAATTAPAKLDDKAQSKSDSKKKPATKKSK